MDTSETYIKMCEQAEEIQKLREEGNFNSQDFVAGNTFDSVVEDLIWLPRQDQLQEMVELPLKEKLYRFVLWALFYTSQFGSAEQLWFAFVMRTNHKKTWDGKEWEAVAKAELEKGGLNNV